MTIGKLARKLLGNKIFSIIARYYRAIFVDLEKVCRSFPEIEDNAHILDVGGGDGELINILLSKKKYIKITMIDISPQVGRSIKPEFMDRVICLPNTGLLEYQSLNDTQIDYILISDVIHHVKRTNLLKFFSDLKILISYNKTKIIIKDMEPGLWRTYLSYYADKYISGADIVNFISKNELISLMKEVFPLMYYEETILWEIDKPNYCIVFYCN